MRKRAAHRPPPTNAPEAEALSIAELSRRVAEGGVVGMGGGGFPTHLKLRSQLDAVIINGAECEPLLDCDYFTLQRHGPEVLRGAWLTARAGNCPEIVLAVKRKNAGLAARLGECPPPVRLRTALLDDVYPSGDELFVIRAALGRTLAQGVIPSFANLYVGNVATLRAVAEAACGIPLTRRMVTVCGAVRRPGTFETPLGVCFGDLVAACGGAVGDVRLVEGGVMMGALVTEEDVVRKTTSGVMALPENHPAVLERLRPLSQSVKQAEHACCQCARCSEMCSRRLLGHDLAPHRLMRLVGSQRDYRSLGSPSLFNCSGCGLCSLVACPFDLSPRRLILEARRTALRRPGPPPEPVPPPEGACYAVPSQKLYARLKLGPYLAPHRFAGVFPTPRTLVVPLQQHAGRPAEAVVGVGQRVAAGALLARAAEGGPSAAVHAPAAGLVAAVDSRITLQCEPEGPLP